MTISSLRASSLHALADNLAKAESTQPIWEKIKKLPLDITDDLLPLLLAKKEFNSCDFFQYPSVVHLDLSSVPSCTLTASKLQWIFDHSKESLKTLILPEGCDFEDVKFGMSKFSSLEKLHISKVIDFGGKRSKELLQLLPPTLLKLDISKEKGQWANAKSLRVTDNQILQLLEGDYPKVQRLDISSSDVTNEILRLISKKFPQLTELYIDNCPVSDFDGCTFPNLQVLSAKKTNLTTEGIKNLAQCSPHLRYLDIGRCKKVISLKECVFPELEELYVQNTIIADDTIKQLSLSSPHLKCLDVSHCKFNTFVGCPFPKLERLKAEGTLLNDASIEELALKSPNLHLLNIDRCMRITALKGSFPKLWSLSAEKTVLSEDTIKQLSLSSPHLKYLNISNCREISSFSFIFPELENFVAVKTKFSSADLKQLSTSSPNLKELIINRCNNITTFQDCKFLKLQELSVSHTKLSNSGIKEISIGCTELLHLNIMKCDDITTIKGCRFPKLITLDATRTGLTNAGIKEIALCCPNLESLAIEGCFQVRNLGDHTLPRLRYLIASDTGFSGTTIKKISTLCPQLRELDISFCEKVTSLNKCRFSNLSYLQLASASVSDESLKGLFTYAPNLDGFTIKPKKKALVAESVSRTNPQKALRIARSIESKKIKNNTIAHIILDAAKDDPGMAAAMLLKAYPHLSEEVKISCVTAVVKEYESEIDACIRSNDVEQLEAIVQKIEALADTITDPSTKLSVIRAVFMRFNKYDNKHHIDNMIATLVKANKDRADCYKSIAIINVARRDGAKAHALLNGHFDYSEAMRDLCKVDIIRYGYARELEESLENERRDVAIVKTYVDSAFALADSIKNDTWKKKIINFFFQNFYELDKQYFMTLLPILSPELAEIAQLTVIDKLVIANKFVEAKNVAESIKNKEIKEEHLYRLSKKIEKFAKSESTSAESSEIDSSSESTDSSEAGSSSETDESSEED